MSFGEALILSGVMLGTLIDWLWLGSIARRQAVIMARLAATEKEEGG